MDYLLENIDEISIDASSRAGRWKKARVYLKEVAEALDASNERLDRIRNELTRIEGDNLKLVGAIRALSDLANEEVQREKSLKLNDDNCGIVIDAPPQVPVAISVEESSSLFEGDLLVELEKLPGIGSKTASGVEAFVRKAGEENARRFIHVLSDVNLAVLGDDAQQIQLSFEDDEGR